jgi:magnesium transporter
MREQILDAVPPANVVTLKQLMTFDPETAGGMMSHDFVRVDGKLTVAESIQVIRDHPAIDFTQIYCVDKGQHLLGVILPRHMLVAPPNTPVVDLIEEDHVGYLRPDTDQEEIAAIFERYDLHEMPVVDGARRMLGVVTVDDVLDVIREEHTEDAYKMVGAGRTEAVYSGLWVKFRGRLPWLLVNVVTSLVAAIVVLQFDDLIAELAILAVLMPVIANQAGNAGQQSLAVTMRGLALGELRGNRAWPLVRREIVVGILNGSLVGCMVGTLIIIMSLTGLRDLPWELGFVVAAAMTVSVAVGCLVGSAMPLIINRLKYDPATASTIFLTMVTDTVSFITFLGLAWILQATLID